MDELDLDQKGPHPSSHNAWQAFANYTASCERILFLVGAGLSAPSGIPTWRGTGGLWNNIDARELASPYKFKEDPALVWRFHGERMLEMFAAKPNAGHFALTDFAKRHENCLTVNQNIDGLLEDAGYPASRLHNIHGTLRTIRCVDCEYAATIGSLEDLPFLLSLSKTNPSSPLALSDLPHCPHCSSLLRPDVVWFGEKLAAGAPDTIDQWIERGPVDLVVVVGTSLRVFPAAEFVETARYHGARLAVVNTDLEDGPVHGLDYDDCFLEGDAATILPMILKR